MMRAEYVAILSFVASLIIALACAVRTRRRERDWLFAQGRIAEMEESRDIDLQTVYAPIVEFTDHHGKVHHVRHKLRGSQSKFRPGQRVAVVYPADDPGQAHIDTIWTKYHTSWMALLISFCSVLAYFSSQYP